jgi:poly-gamma-glutamate capsule biosynthesis protein CapA/YwtB (metallophosphatase superfamily)
MLCAGLDLAFTGDVMFGRYGRSAFMHTDEGDPFREHADVLASDFTLVNLETPIAAKVPSVAPRPGQNRFGAEPRALKLLRDAGVGAVSMANNHAYDLGPTQMLDAKAAIVAQGLSAFAAPRLADTAEALIGCEEVQIKSEKACLIAVSAKSNVFFIPKPWPKVPYTRSWRLQHVLVPIVKAAARKYALVIVFVHWGDEYKDTPSDAQRKVAHRLVDAGARLIIGHHPHVVQGFERYRDR